MRADRQPGGRRNYKLTVKDPLPTSFGEDLYYRLGAWLEEDKPLAPVADVAAAPGGEHPPGNPVSRIAVTGTSEQLTSADGGAAGPALR